MGKDVPEDPPEDIPAWFMTYSDVITLLMTFFILLLTFATTEPERFEKVTVNFFGESGATGVSGHEHDHMDKSSWSERVRPRAARIALQGTEIPPIEKEVENGAKGRGLEGVSEAQSQRDVMKSYSMEIPISSLVDGNLRITKQGTEIAAQLAGQLRSLSIHIAFEISSQAKAERICAFAHHLYHVQQARPGQIGVGFVSDLNSESVRVVIEQYETNR